MKKMVNETYFLNGAFRFPPENKSFQARQLPESKDVLISVLHALCIF